ncbi:MAG: alpha/beta hydrolase [Alicyclobacillus sp.]|nr:alpha/beta hydrolase [Alicyclobacillus sp.]
MTEQPLYKVCVVRDLVYVQRPEAALRMDLYLPQGTSLKVPVIIWIHGGGWRIGDRKLAPDLTAYFAQHGFAMVSIDYRLSQQAIFPAQIQDVQAAIRWVREHGAMYGMDASRIGLWGSSAGGHLAALAGTTGDFSWEESEVDTRTSVLVQAVVDGYGPIDFISMYHPDEWAAQTAANVETRQVALARGSVDSSREEQLLGAPLLSVPDRVAAANPITYVKQGMPPFLILHGLLDELVPVSQSERLYHALKASGNRVTACFVEGARHGFFNDNDFLNRVQERVYLWRYDSGLERIETCVNSVCVAQLCLDFFRKHLCTKEH